MSYLPPEVVGLLLALAVVAGVVMMFGMRVAMRRQVEPLSAGARWLLVVMLAVVAGGGYAVYALATRARW